MRQTLRALLRGSLLLASAGSASPLAQKACEELRLAWQKVAETGLDYYADATQTGAAKTDDRGERGLRAREALVAASNTLAELRQRFGTFEQTCLQSDAPGSTRAAARLCQAFFLLLLQPRSEGRQRLGDGLPPGDGLEEFIGEEPWSGMLHSGWPVFSIAALVEMEFRDPPTESLIQQRYWRQDPKEGCSEDQEAFREIAVLYAGEGRTVRLLDIRHYLRDFLKGDSEVIAGLNFLLELVNGEPRQPGQCPAALGTAYAALADALQCHWHRPRSTKTQELADISTEKAQRGVREAFGEGGQGFAALLRSRWPLLSFMGRLQPMTRFSEDVANLDHAIVSWSSREAEMGGLNWAERFAYEVFDGLPGVQLKPDIECADVYVYRSKVPINFGGVLIFVDGERSPEDSLQDDLLRRYPASIVVGPMPAGGLSVWFPVPYVSTSFASRLAATPAKLAQPRSMPEPHTRRFAAYLAFRCWPHREQFFHLLDSISKDAGLEGVDVLSRCGNTSMEEDTRRSERYSTSYMDDAADLFRRYRFAMVFENRLSPRYVTEKIVNAYLSGAVPIYWGSPFAIRMFNPHSMIYANAFISFEAAARKVVEIAQDPEAYSRYATAPILKNTTAARYPFSWHRDAPSLPDGAPTLREELAEVALKKHRSGLSGMVTAVERRPWDYADAFPL